MTGCYYIIDGEEEPKAPDRVSFEHNNSKITSFFAFPITLWSHMGHGTFKCFLRYARFFWQRFCTCNNRLACVHKRNLKCTLCNLLQCIKFGHRQMYLDKFLILVFAHYIISINRHFCVQTSQRQWQGRGGGGGVPLKPSTF
jgi:hypothetical protein